MTSYKRKIILLVRVCVNKGGNPMFIRTEKSIRDFITFYPIVSIIVVINILIWLLMYVFSFPIGNDLTIGRVIYAYGVGFNPAVMAGEYWRLFTPIFLHGGFSHVAFNSFSLILFGPALEQMLGRFKFIIAYILTGLAGNVGTYVIDPMSTTPHLGASGAIYGLFGIYLFMIYFRKHLIDKANASIVQTIFVIGLVMTFIQPNINIAAHIFGFIGGFAIGPVMLKNVQPFSMERNYARRRATFHDGDIQFDPNRWNKRRLIPPKLRKYLFWFIFGGLVLLGIISSYFAR